MKRVVKIFDIVIIMISFSYCKKIVNNKTSIPERIFSVIFLFSAIICLDSCEKKEYVVGPATTISFDIFVASDDIPLGRTVQLDELHLLQPPFLSLSDISSYKWENHHISYPDSVWDRLKTWGNLLHKIFVVNVGDERIYWGRFMDYLDSAGCQNPVITLIPRHADGRNTTPGLIVIEREYPIYVRPESYPDPRNDYRIYNALFEAGVLVDLEKVGVSAE